MGAVAFDNCMRADQVRFFFLKKIKGLECFCVYLLSLFIHVDQDAVHKYTVEDVPFHS